MARAQAGDRGALDALLRRHYPRIHAVCRRMTGHDADAADAAQNALIGIARGLPRFDGRSPFTTWAYRVAMNASFDELRRRARRPLVSLDALSDDGARAPASRVDKAAERMDVDQALRQLPQDFRAPVVLRDLCGLDYLEISDVLGVPIGTVKSRIARGRAALVPLLRAGGERSEA